MSLRAHVAPVFGIIITSFEFTLSFYIEECFLNRYQVEAT